MKKITLLLIITLNLTFVNNNFAQKNYQQADSLRKIYQKNEDYNTALIYANKALKFAEDKYGKNDTIYADMLSAIVEVYYYTDSLNKAIKCLLEQKKIREKKQGKTHPAYCVVIGDLAVSYYEMGQYDKALPLYIEALEITENTLGKEHADYGFYLTNLAMLYERMGRYNKALPLYIEAIKITENTLGKKNYEYGRSLSQLASLYSVKGQYDKALPLYIEAKEITKNTLGKNNSQYGRNLNDLASLYKSMGQYNKALHLYIEAIEITKNTLGKNHSQYAMWLNNLAQLYQNMGQYDKALPLYIEAIEITKNTVGKNHSLYATNINNLAGLYQEMGQYDKALSLYNETIEIIKNIVGENHSNYASGINNLAVLYQEMGQHNKALPLYIEAIGIMKNTFGKEHSYYTSDINNLAGLYQEMGQYKKALPLYIEGINNINKDIIKNFGFLSEKEKEAYFDMESNSFDKFNSFALLHQNKFKDITTVVFDNTVRNKGILLKSSTAMRTAILSSKDTILIKKYNKWISLKKEIVKLYSMPINKRQQDPKQLEEQANVLERDLVKNSEEFSAFTQTLKNNWKDVRKALKPNEVAIEFMHFKLIEKKWTDTIMYCALIVTPNSNQPKMIPLFEEKQLEKIIGKFGGNNYSYINSIYGKNTEINKELYNLIWKPMEASLKGAKKVYLSPSGLLHKISFSAIAKDKNVYLCDAYDIEVKSSTGKITENSHQISQRDQMTNATLFGGINYDTDSTKQKVWNYLEGTKTETQKIDKILKKGKVDVNYFSNTLATEEEFKLMANNSNILHIATHGFFYPDPKEVAKNEEEKKAEYSDVVFRGGSRGFGVNSFVENNNPLMRSGLVFAGANDVWSKQTDNDTIDDGVLTAQEVSNIDMRKTDLVVMSACETGLGDIKGSEGVYGLQRAFKMAGVKYEIMSLWQVPDKETEEFMTSFYKKLIKQKDIKLAFADTQKEMRKKYDPYFWAAFVLIE